MIITNKSCDNFMDDAYQGTTSDTQYNSLILYKEELKNLNIQKAIVKGGDFIDCGFEGAVFDGGEYSDVIFKLCDMTQAAFAGCKFKHVRFVDCLIENTDFSSATFDNVEFIRCEGPIITEDADLTNVNILKCDIQDSNLSDTAMFNVVFRESNLNDACFSGSFAMEVTFEKTSIVGADLDWGAVHYLKTDGYFDDALKLLKSSGDKKICRPTHSICHNAVLITG